MKKLVEMKKVTLFIAAFVAAIAMTLALGMNSEAKAKPATKKTGATIKITNVKKIVGNRTGDKKILVNVHNNEYHICRTGKVTVVKKSGAKKVYRVKTRKVKNASINATEGSLVTIPVTTSWSEKIAGHKWHVKSSNSAVVANRVSVTYHNNNTAPIIQVEAVGTGSAKVTVTSPCGVAFVTPVTVSEAAVDQKEENNTLPEINEAKADEGKVVVDDQTQTDANAEAAAQAARDAAETAEKAANGNDAEAAQQAADSAAKAADAAEEAAKSANTEAADTAAEEARAAAERAAAAAAEAEAKAQAEAEAEAAAKAEAEAAAKAEALKQAIELATTYRELESGETTEIVIPEGYKFVAVEGRYGIISVTVSDNVATATAQAKGVVYVTFADAEGNTIQTPVAVTK